MLWLLLTGAVKIDFQTKKKLGIMKRWSFFFLAFILAVGVAFGGGGVDSITVVLPSGDSVGVVLPDFPDEVTDVGSFLGLWDAVFVLLVLVVGFFRDRVPVLNRIEDKELMILAFTLSAVVVVMFARALTGGDVWGALRLVVDAAIATRIYAWGYKVLLSLYGKVRDVIGGDNGNEA